MHASREPCKYESSSVIAYALQQKRIISLPVDITGIISSSLGLRVLYMVIVVHATSTSPISLSITRTSFPIFGCPSHSSVVSLSRWDKSCVLVDFLEVCIPLVLFTIAEWLLFLASFSYIASPMQLQNGQTASPDHLFICWILLIFSHFSQLSHGSIFVSAVVACALFSLL